MTQAWHLKKQCPDISKWIEPVRKFEDAVFKHGGFSTGDFLTLQYSWRTLVLDLFWVS
jgi:hypothetical protein